MRRGARIRKARLALVAFAAAGLVGGCDAILGLDQTQLGSLDGAAPGSDGGDATQGRDAGDATVGQDARDGSSPGDAADSSPPPTDSQPLDAPPPSDAADAGDGDADAAMPFDASCTGPDGGPGYHDIGALGCWSLFDLLSADGGVADFEGAVFDGRYLYLVPDTSTVVPQYDTTGAFTNPASWKNFDANALVQGGEYSGGVFDGRYLYLVPNTDLNNPGVPFGLVVRYDTTASFTAASSWSTFDVTTLDPAAGGFAGATFDGQYIYLVPLGSRLQRGNATRYDTHSGFTSASSWAFFNTATVNANAVGFQGAVFDGQFVYYVPDANVSVAARFDTTGNFTTATSWTTFDLKSLNAAAVGFVGGGFDGQYVYYAPYGPSSMAPTSIVARYDNVGGGFTTGTSWSLFDTSALDPSAAGFYTAAVDGRYVYFIPYSTDFTSGTLLTRVDTQGTFANSSSWSTFDLGNLNTTLAGFAASAFDGRYLYLAGLGRYVARFDAKTPPAQPNLPAFHGSFY